MTAWDIRLVAKGDGASTEREPETRRNNFANGRLMRWFTLQR